MLRLSTLLVTSEVSYSTAYVALFTPDYDRTIDRGRQRLVL